MVRAAMELEISEPRMIGHLHLLWWWALAYADDGDLSGFTVKEIERGARWDGPLGDLVAALESVGFIVEGRQLNDWWDYAGKLVERRQKDRERKQEARRKSTARPQDRPQDGSGSGVRTQPTVPNPTEPENGEAPNHRELVAAIALWMTGDVSPQLPKGQWGRIGKAAKELAEIGATPADVADRGSRWWKDMTKSPQGLTDNWSELGARSHVCEFRSQGVWGSVCVCGKRKETA